MTRLIHTLLMLLVALSPLPLGSNREWSWTLCAIIAGSLALLWALQALLRPRQATPQLPVPVYVLFLATCGWAGLQASDWLPASWNHPLWAMSGEVLGSKLAGHVTLSEEDTVTALVRLLSYGLVFYLSFQVCRDRTRAASALRWIAGAGLAYGILGLLNYWGAFETIPWLHSEQSRRSVHGSFVNRNHFATYLGLGTLCLLAGFHSKLALRRNPLYTLPTDPREGIEHFILRAWKSLAALLLMICALVLTQSRAGFGSFMAAAMVLVIAVGYRQRLSGARTAATLATAFGITILAFFLTSEVLLKRMDQLNLMQSNRMDAYALTADAITDNALLGFGYGTYANSFRLYRDDSLTEYFDHAHNTWLENLFELGWPAAGALFLAIAWIALVCLQGLRRRSRDWIFPATGLAATVLVALHSLFDFSLQIPAVAITYACLMGAACAQSYSASPRPGGA